MADKAEKMCKLAKADKTKKIKKLAEGAKYVCKSCGRAAAKEENLCKPDAI